MDIMKFTALTAFGFGGFRLQYGYQKRFGSG